MTTPFAPQYNVRPVWADWLPPPQSEDQRALARLWHDVHPIVGCSDERVAHVVNDLWARLEDRPEPQRSTDQAALGAWCARAAGTALSLLLCTVAAHHPLPDGVPPDARAQIDNAPGTRMHFRMFDPPAQVAAALIRRAPDSVCAQELLRAWAAWLTDQMALHPAAAQEPLVVEALWAIQANTKELSIPVHVHLITWGETIASHPERAPDPVASRRAHALAQTLDSLRPIGAGALPAATRAQIDRAVLAAEVGHLNRSEDRAEVGHLNRSEDRAEVGHLNRSENGSQPPPEPQRRRL